MLLGTATTLPDGLHLHVRLPRTAEHAAVRALLERLGLTAGDLELTRALRFDPRRRTVACATAWNGREQQLVALGAMDAGAREPDLLLADEQQAPGAGAVLVDALHARSQRAVA